MSIIYTETFENGAGEWRAAGEAPVDIEVVRLDGRVVLKCTSNNVIEVFSPLITVSPDIWAPNGFRLTFRAKGQTSQGLRVSAPGGENPVVALRDDRWGDFQHDFGFAGLAHFHVRFDGFGGTFYLDELTVETR